jgi:hypothetical protein
MLLIVSEYGRLLLKYLQIYKIYVRNNKAKYVNEKGPTTKTKGKKIGKISRLCITAIRS